MGQWESRIQSGDQLLIQYSRWEDSQVRDGGILSFNLFSSVRWVLVASSYGWGENSSLWKLLRPQSWCHFYQTSDIAEFLNPGPIFGYLMVSQIYVFSHREVENAFYKGNDQGWEGQNLLCSTPPFSGFLQEPTYLMLPTCLPKWGLSKTHVIGWLLGQKPFSGSSPFR